METIKSESKQCQLRTTASPVKNVVLYHLPVITDDRGHLTVAEFSKEVPFMPKRYFMVYAVGNENIRGEHAHKICHQFLVCVKGQCSVIADDGYQKEKFLLNQPNIGLYLPPMTWGIQYEYSQDAVLLVFASDFYDPDDYIRDYDLFCRCIGVK